MTDYRGSFLQALYDAPLRSKFIEELEVVIIWSGPNNNQFIVNFVNTSINPVKSLEITDENDLLVLGENSRALLPLVDPTGEGTINCLDGNILTYRRALTGKKIHGDTFIDYQKTKFSKIIDGRQLYYDKWFNVTEPEPLNFVLPQDINTADVLIGFETSDRLQVIRGITIERLNYAILPEWHAIGEHPYYIKMGGDKYIILSYTDSKFDRRVCLTNAHECIEFNVATRCEPIDGLYNGHVLSKINHDNITLHIGDVFLEYVADKKCYIVSNAANPKSGNCTKGAIQLSD